MKDASLAAPGGAAATVQLLYVISGQLWGVAGLFFGMWLIPTGWVALESGWMPRALGWLLVGGGVAYALGTLLVYVAPDASAAGQLLTAPATIGEFWMIGYLLVLGVRAHPTRPESANRA